MEPPLDQGYSYSFSRAIYTYLHWLLSHPVVQISVVSRLSRSLPVIRWWCLFLLVAGVTQVLVLTLKDRGSSVDSAKGLGGNGRAVGADGGADGHEEAGAICQRRFEALQSLHIPKSGG
jgi:hypothetical protein